MTLRTSIFDRLDNSPVRARSSIERLAECAPSCGTQPEASRYGAGESKGAWPLTGTAPVRLGSHPYIDDTPVMQAAHAALEAEARETAAALIKMQARARYLRTKARQIARRTA